MTELLFLHWRHLSRGERIALVLLFATLAASIWIPATAQDQRYHAFADQRAMLGVAHAADVLSNLAFVAVGAFGVVMLLSLRDARFLPATRASLWCVALGLLGTAAGSAWYHLDPNDESLTWDRLPLTLVFSGVLALAMAQRIGPNVSRVALAALFELGMASIIYWRVTGDLSLYLTLQYGGLVAIMFMVIVTPRRDDTFAWWWLVGWYVLAKVFEIADAGIWEATHGIVAGHMLKHLAAAIAAAVLFLPLRAPRASTIAGEPTPQTRTV